MSRSHAAKPRCHKSSHCLITFYCKPITGRFSFSLITSRSHLRNPPRKEGAMKSLLQSLTDVCEKFDKIHKDFQQRNKPSKGSTEDAK